MLEISCIFLLYVIMSCVLKSIFVVQEIIGSFLFCFYGDASLLEKTSKRITSLKNLISKGYKLQTTAMSLILLLTCKIYIGL